MKRLCTLIIALSIMSCNTENESSEITDSTSLKNEIEISNIQDQQLNIKEEVEVEDISNNKQLKEWNDILGVFIFDIDDLPTNVRNKPKGDIILKLPKTGDYEVWLNGELNGWFKVDEIQEINENTIHENVNGYIHGSILAASTSNYGGEKIHLYKKSNVKTEIVTTLTQETMVFLVSSDKKGEWLKVRVKKDELTYDGWIQSKWLCGSIRTNCS